MRWYRDIRKILDQEPEEWMAYRHGVQLDNTALFTRSRPRFPGVPLRLLVLVYFLLRHLSWYRVPRGSRGDEVRFVVFAGSRNQESALEGVVNSLRRDSGKVLGIGRPGRIARTEDATYTATRFGTIDELKAVVLMAMRGWALYKRLRKKNRLALKWYFNRFCYVYIYLVYFQGLLNELNPEYVITSNDHSVANRCLFAIARSLGIKSVYMQHASVSYIFPALRMDYAFLDGQAALDIYRHCESNQPPGGAAGPIPKVFLTGQKKRLIRSEKSETSWVGVALNALDEPEAVRELICRLVEAGEAVCVRWHPGLNPKQIERYLNALHGHPEVRLSDPREEPVADFLEGLRTLIAGNTSIHLEAALAGVIPIYYEFGPPDDPDIYGYVACKLSRKAGSSEQLMQYLQEIGEHTLNEDAIRYYSATFQTEWEGREGELVADCILKIAEGCPEEEIFGAVPFHCTGH